MGQQTKTEQTQNAKPIELNSSLTATHKLFKKQPNYIYLNPGMVPPCNQNATCLLPR